jgi:D-amino-acid dehydrogenase
MSRKVLIVGGGVVGTACAHYLTEAGCKVTIVDQGHHGRGCSHGNCGYISPSHVLPLTEPGIIRTALKSLFRKDSPFRVKPRLDLGLIRWFWKFGRRCNFRDMMAAAEGIQPLLLSSIELYRELLRQHDIECEWQERGLLYAYRSRERFEQYATTNVLMRDRFNEGARRLEADELQAFEPALLPGLAGGWFYEHDAHLRADRLMTNWRTLLESRGVAIREQTAVAGLPRAGSAASGVRTATGEILHADTVIVATGAWAPFLAEELGCRIPIQPGKGYSITMPRPAICPRTPMIFPETKVAVTPWESGYRLGSTMEFAGYDTTIHRARLDLLRNGARNYLREPYCEPVLEEWYGWRPMTWDSVPIIDRAPRWDNVYIAAGHNMLGLSMATGTGKLIRELVLGETPHLDPSHYRATRFQ